MAPKFEEDRYFSPIFFSFRVFSSPENNFDTFFVWWWDLSSFLKEKKENTWEKFWGGGKEILDVFGRMILVRHLRRQKYPQVRKINEKCSTEKRYRTVVVRSRIKEIITLLNCLINNRTAIVLRITHFLLLFSLSYSSSTSSGS